VNVAFVATCAYGSRVPQPKNQRVRAWLKEQRLAAGYSNVRDKLLPALAAAGIEIDYSTYATYESEASKAGFFANAQDKIEKEIQPFLDEGVKQGWRLHSFQSTESSKGINLVFIWEVPDGA